MARCLAEQRYKMGRESIVTVVVAGDTSTVVSSYRFQYEAGSVPRLVAHDSCSNQLPFGLAHWTGRLLINVNDLFTEPIRSSYELAMRDAAGRATAPAARRSNCRRGRFMRCLSISSRSGVPWPR